MPSLFPSIIVRLAENGYLTEALAAASTSCSTYWNELIWDHVAHARSEKKYRLAYAARSRTRVMEAAFHGREERLSWLLQRRGVAGHAFANPAGSLVSHIDFSGLSALHYALEAQHVECIAMLVRAGAFWVNTNRDYAAPMTTAFAGSSELAISITKAMVSIEPSKQDMSVIKQMFCNAVKHGHVDCVSLFLANRPELLSARSTDTTPIWYQVFGFLLSRNKANDDIVARYPLLITNFTSLLRLLFDIGFEPPTTKSVDRGVLMASACRLSNVEAVRFLLDRDQFSREAIRTGMFEYVYRGIDRSKYGEITQLLIDNGALVKAPGPISNQPLWQAVRAYAEESVTRLIEAGAIRLQRQGASELFSIFTSLNENIPAPELEIAGVLAKLLSTGIHRKKNGTKYFNEALQVMCRWGYLSCMKLLVAEGASVNILEEDTESTLLHLLCGSKVNNPEAVDFLLEKGVPAGARNAYSDTALSLAIENKYEECVVVLLTSSVCIFPPKMLESSLRTVLFHGRKGLDESSENIVKLLLEFLPADYLSSATDNDAQMTRAEALFKCACEHGSSATIISCLLELLPPTSVTYWIERLLPTVCRICPSKDATNILKLFMAQLPSTPGDQLLLEILVIACSKGYAENIQFLLEIGGPDIANDQCFRALNDDFECAILLLRNLTNPAQIISNQLFLDFVRFGSYEILKAILSVYKPVFSYSDKNIKTPLLTAVRCDSKSSGEVIHLLIQHGYAEWNATEAYDALVKAIQYDSEPCVRSFLESSIPVALLYNAFKVAIDYGRTYCIRAILELAVAGELDMPPLQTMEVRRCIELAIAGEDMLLADIIASEYGNLAYAQLLSSGLHIFVKKINKEKSFIDIVDKLTIFRALGVNLNEIFMNTCSSRDIPDVFRQALFACGANVSVHKTTGKPLLYHVAKYYFDPLLLRLMIQAAGCVDVPEFEAAVLVSNHMKVRSILPWTPESKFK